MRLAKFILANLEPILPQWEAFARSLLPGASLTIMQLRGSACPACRVRWRAASIPRSHGAA